MEGDKEAPEESLTCMGGARKASWCRQHLAGAFQKDAAGGSQEEKLGAENSTCIGPEQGLCGSPTRCMLGRAEMKRRAGSISRGTSQTGSDSS